MRSNAGTDDGSIFLVSQLSYLRSLRRSCDGSSSNDSSAIDIHFMCTERLQQDWEALVERLGAYLDLAAPRTTMNNRSMNRSPRSMAASTPSPEDAAFIRDSMFPWDTQLHLGPCAKVGDRDGAYSNVAHKR